MNSAALEAAKADYYATMIDGIHAVSDHLHWKAAQHLESVAVQCIEAGACQSDAYVLYIKEKRQGRVIADRLIRHLPVATIGELREAIADLPDDLRLIKTEGGRNVCDLDLYVNRWIYSIANGQSVEDYAVRVG